MDLSLRKFRKNIAAFSVLALVASFLVVGTANAALATDVYEDVDGTEWYAPDVQWGLDSGILDDTQAYFRAGDNATRAEFFKMTAAGAGIPEAACDETLFPDLDADHWGCGWVTAMAEALIVSGDGAGSPTPGHVRPNDNILRAEAAKVVVEAYGLTGTTPGTVFDDVDGSEWYSDYAGIANENCVFRGVGSTLNLEPGRNIVRAEAIAVVNRGAHPTTECAVIIPATGALTVAVDGSTPVGVDIPNNGANIPYVVFALTAEAGGEDVRIEELTLTRQGLGLPGDFDSVKLYVDGVQLGSQKTVNTSTNTATFSLAGDPIFVPAGATVLLTVRADMAGADNSQNAFCIYTPDDVLVYGESSNAEVAAGGSFAACGEYMTTTSASVGTLTYEYDDYTGDINIGETDISAARLRLEADNTEDMDVEMISFKQRGSADPIDFANPALYISGVQIADSSVAIWEGDFLMFDLSADPIFIERGNSKNVELRVDVVGGLGSTMLFEIYRDWHIEATGRVYHYGVNVEESLTPPAVLARDIIGGNLAFALSSENPTVGDMLGDAEDHEFLNFNVSTAGEGVTLNGFDVIITYVNGAADLYEELQDVKVWSKNSADDWVSIGILDPTAGCLNGLNAVPPPICNPTVAPVALTLAFTDTWDLAPNTTTPFMITADGNSAPNLAEYYISFDATSVDAEYSQGDPVAPADISGGILQGNVQTVALPTLNVAVAAAPGDTNVVGGTLDLEPINWDLTASSAADILVTSVTVTCTYADVSGDGDDCADVYSNLELNHKDGTSYLPLDTASFSAGLIISNVDTIIPSTDDIWESTAVFNGLNFTVPAGQVKKFALTANSSKAGDDTDTASFNIAVSGDVAAEYTEDTITPTVDATMVTHTFIGAGTLTVSVDGNTPASDSVVAGDTGVYVGKVKLAANVNEDILVQKLRLMNDAGTACTTAGLNPANAFAATVTITDGVNSYDSVLAGAPGQIEFDFSADPYVIPKDGYITLDVLADTNLVTPGGAASGDCISLAPVTLGGLYDNYETGGIDVKAVGASSGIGLDGTTSNVLGGTGYTPTTYTAGFGYYALRHNVPTFILSPDSPAGNTTPQLEEEVFRFDVDVAGSGSAIIDTFVFSATGSCVPVADFALYKVEGINETKLTTGPGALTLVGATHFLNSTGIEINGGENGTYLLKVNTGSCVVDPDTSLILSLDDINWTDGKEAAPPIDSTDIDIFPLAGNGLIY